MLRIDDKMDDRQRTIQTNDIPRNTTFKGTITMPYSGNRRTGIWFNLGTYADPRSDDKSSMGPIVVSLTPRGAITDPQWSSVHCFLSQCSLVEDYEPVDVLMTVTPIK